MYSCCNAAHRCCFFYVDVLMLLMCVSPVHHKDFQLSLWVLCSVGRCVRDNCRYDLKLDPSSLSVCLGSHVDWRDFDISTWLGYSRWSVFDL